MNEARMRQIAKEGNLHPSNKVVRILRRVAHEERMASEPTSQTRLSSLIEAVINVAIGFVVSVVITAVVLPIYGHHVTFSHNLQITSIFTIASILRSYIVRRWFNARIHRAAARIAKETA